MRDSRAVYLGAIILVCIFMVLGCFEEGKITGNAPGESTSMPAHQRAILTHDTFVQDIPAREENPITGGYAKDRVIVKLKDGRVEEFFAELTHDYPGASLRKLFDSKRYKNLSEEKNQKIWA
jgi:hypothetical protein